MFRKFIIAAAVFVCTVAALTVTSSAKTYSWDGKTAMTAGNTYTIPEDKTVYVSKSVTVPEDAKLVVRGNLKFTKGANLYVKGYVGVAQSGVIATSGTVTVAQSATFDSYGGAQYTLSSVLNIVGSYNVYNKGKFETSGALNIYGTGKIYNKGYIIFLKSSITKLSGQIESIKNSEMHVQGSMSITLNGKLSNGGYMTLGRNSVFKNSGSFTLLQTANFTRFGEIINTQSGIYKDLREVYSHENLTVSTIVDEPDVVLHGFDVSFAQKDIDWAKVSESGMDFVIIRAARGALDDARPLKVDDYFEKNIKGATENGIDAGVYFYSYATNVEEIKAEAYFFVDTIKDYDITYPVMLDMEEELGGLSEDTITEMVEAFFEITMEAGYYPMLYSYKNWLESKLDMRILDKYAIWLAQYNDAVTYQGGYYIWQYTSKGRVSGINGDVDLNISYRDFADILRRNKLNNLN